MKHSLSLIFLVAAACGPAVPTLETKGVSTALEAARATGKANLAVWNVALKASGKTDKDGMVTGDCLQNGKKTGSFTRKLIGTLENRVTLQSFDLAFNNCITDFGELYGSATWTYSASSVGSGSAQYVLAASGTLGVKLDGGAVQANVTFKDMQINADVQQMGTTVNYTIEVSGGTVDFGNKSFTLTPDELREIFPLTLPE